MLPTPAPPTAESDGSSDDTTADEMVDEEVAPAPAVPIASAPTPEPEAEPVDDVVLPPVFTVDSGGGLVDPVLSGRAEAGAAIVVTADDGRTWTATADAAGAWNLTAEGSRSGAVGFTAVQTDAAGNTSAASPPIVVDLMSPSLELRRSGYLVWHATFAGVPGATVQVLVDGATATTVTLDATGSARFIGLGWMDSAATIEVRYAVDARTGPLSTATVDAD